MSDTYIGDEGNNYEWDPKPQYGYTKLYGAVGDDLLGTSVQANIQGVAYLDGGQGHDYLAANWDAGLTTAEFYGGPGNDHILGGATTDGDVIYGGDGDDFVEQQPGKSGPDYIEGGRGRDALRAEAGNDTVYGGDGSDSGTDITVGGFWGVVSLAPGLFGGAGDDYLDGGRGMDLLDGGAGTDTLTGGPDNDIFRFNDNDSPKGPGRDAILDFRKGDVIDVHLIDAKAGGFDDSFKFIGKKGFHDKPGELRFAGQKLQGDTDGDGTADFEVKLDGVTKLKDVDLIL